jgi:hypothetical protein
VQVGEDFAEVSGFFSRMVPRARKEGATRVMEDMVGAKYGVSMEPDMAKDA